MRFVKGNKNIPFYKENSKPSKKPIESSDSTMKGEVKASSEPVTVSSANTENAQNSGAVTNVVNRSRGTGKPGSVTDVISSLRNVPTARTAFATEKPEPISQSAQEDPSKWTEEPKMAEQKIEKLEKVEIEPQESVAGNDVSQTVCDTQPRVIETYGGTAVSTVSVNEVAEKFRNMVEEVDDVKERRKKRKRIALIASVVGLCFAIILGSVAALFLLPNFENITVPSEHTDTASEPLLPTGTPMIEYALMSTSVKSGVSTINLSLASAESLLEIRVVDENGEPITGIPFELTVIDPNGESETYIMADEQGFFELNELEEEGGYVVILHPIDGYPVIEPKSVNVTLEVDTKPLDEEELKDKIKDESDIVVSEEDSEYGNDGAPSGATDGSSSTQPTATVVKYVESTATDKVVTPAVVTYTSKTADNSFVIADGQHAGTYEFVLDANGKIIGLNKLVNGGSELATVSTGLFDFSDFFVYLSDPVPINDPDTATSVLDSSTSSSDSSESSSSTDGGNSSPDGSSSSTDGGNSSPDSADSSSESSSSSSDSGSSSSSDSSTSDSQSTPEPTPQPIPTDVLFTTVDGVMTMNEPFASHAVQSKTDAVTEKVYTGWQDIGGEKYYYDENNKMVTGYVSIGGVEYYFDLDGTLSTDTTNGIDVSKWQGNINWASVKASGIEWAIIRAGYRGYSTGALVEDPYYRQNINGAVAAGLDVGIYIFSQAITVQEAVEEASFCLSLAAGYNMKYGITFDTEYQSGGRANNISTSLRTQIANAFCDTVRQGGKIPMIYASKSWFIHQLDYYAIDHNRIWLAHYTTATDFAYRYDIWQYTGSGSCPGVSGHVDRNYGYI